MGPGTTQCAWRAKRAPCVSRASRGEPSSSTLEPGLSTPPGSCSCTRILGCRRPPELRWRNGFRSDPDSSALYFRFALEGEGWFWRFIELGQWIRERVSGLVYGDQGLLVAREAFDAIGGYPELPLMEDVEIVRRLRARRGPHSPQGTPPHEPPRLRPVREMEGMAPQTPQTISLYLAGIDPHRLARWYPRGRHSTEDQVGLNDSFDGRALMVLREGAAAGLCEDSAGRGHWRTTRRHPCIESWVGKFLDQVRDGSYRTVVYYAPPGAGSSVREWLGDAGVEYRPQNGDGLGERLEHAFRRGVQGVPSVSV